MKKILVALAFAAFASTTYATVENSAHDFNYSSTYSTNKSSRCVYCHVPHNAMTWASTALWAIAQPTGTFTYYSGSTTGSVEIRRSQTCLACHADETNAPVDAAGVDVLAVTVQGVKSVGYDLTNDHPIGTDFVITPGSNGMKTPLTLGRTNFVTSTGRTVECAVCHSVHGPSEYTISGRKLLYGPGNATALIGQPNWPEDTDFCNICHTR